MTAPADLLANIEGLAGADRLRRIAAMLPAEDASWLLENFAPPWMRRAHRLERRDAAIRDLAGLLAPGAGPAEAARAIESALRRYAGTVWPRESGLAELPDASAERRLLHAILRANGGATLGVRQLANVLTGARTPAA
jgi:hypothetical protein